jgi:hypothetical protein
MFSIVSIVSSLLLFIVLINGNEIRDYKNNTVEFINVYENQGLKFSTAYFNINNSNIINHTHYLLNETEYKKCFLSCVNNNECHGIYTYKKTNVSCCLELREIGNALETNETGDSYIKLTKDNHDTDLHELSVYVIQNNNTNWKDNITIYLDLNHNGELEDDEPFITKNREQYHMNISFTLDDTSIKFSFKNLKKGQYLIRQKLSDSCIQYYPGINGSKIRYKGDGYVDNVIEYHHHKNSRFIGAYGSFITSPEKISDPDFNFILGNKKDRYMSFQPHNNITFAFIDETILNMNKTDDDFIIDIFNKSNTNTKAIVSVSSDNIDYYYLGVLSNDNFRFNMGDIILTIPISYIRLEFFGENLKDSFDIISIRGSMNSIY